MPAFRFTLALPALALAGAIVAAATASSAFAADTNSNTYNWSGFSAGVHAGLGADNTNWQDNPINSPNIDMNGLGGVANSDGAGGFGGGQIGYDWQFPNNVVVGLGGSFSGADFTGTQDADKFNMGWTLRNRTNWLATVTGRVGYAVNQILFYGRGGLAVDNNTFGVANVGTDLGTEGATNVGWTAGAGVEWAVGPKLSLFTEADYYGFGDQTVNFPGNANGAGANAPFGTSINQSIETLQFGVNYRF
jgi:outer membrane immunogenic protein